FNMYRWHITDPIYFKNDLRVTLQSIGWTNDRHFRARRDDISSVAYWYSDNMENDYLPLPPYNELEIYV
ncbi:MAG: DUF2961 domain-containing protein, partial [Oscillospiraceae bacterium]|nr:DUF2961 domain-containing protein [Candidatus Equicaccousia limihippi]